MSDFVCLKNFKSGRRYFKAGELYDGDDQRLLLNEGFIKGSTVKEKSAAKELEIEVKKQAAKKQALTKKLEAEREHAVKARMAARKKMGSVNKKLAVEGKKEISELNKKALSK